MSTRLGIAGLFVVGLGTGLALSLPGCGGDGESCPVAREGCACTTSALCDPGLTCLSGRCVRPSGSDGAAGMGGAGGGTAGMGGAGGTGGMGIDYAKICDDFSGKVCDQINRCVPLYVKVEFGDVTTCVARQKVDCLASAMAPDTQYTMATATACIQALGSASCEDLVYRKIPACSFKGRRSNGQGCGVDDQCQSGRCGTTTMMCGVCSDLVKAGGVCNEDEDCEPGLACNQDGRCILPGAGGTACSPTQPCKLGFYCRMGSCAASVAEAGGVCDHADGCEWLQGLFCNSSLARCQRIRHAASGEACGVLSGDFVLCSAGDCLIPGGQTRGLCSAWAKDGETCGPTRACQDPASCVSGRCQLASPSRCPA